MFKRTNNFIFILLFLSVLSLPLLSTDWESGGISQEENRNLAEFPELTVNNRFNLSFTQEFETWFMDHIGFRQSLIHANKMFMQKLFDRTLTNSDVKTGKTGDYIYAPDYIIEDFAHVNLWTEEEVIQIGNSYQTINDWLAAKDIPFYYIQCVDKQTVYPERFIADVKQIGSISKTDQVLNYLQCATTVKAVYLKQVLIDSRTEYDVFSHWGDSSHWTPRGAYIGYRYMMDQINADFRSSLETLKETDYDITYQTIYGPEDRSEQIELFTIRTPSAKKDNVSVMGEWAEDYRHSIWKNPTANNNHRLLLICDSYFNDYLVDDLAESFQEVWLIWGDYLESLPDLVALCDPDIVIFECAERVDRSLDVMNLAETLQSTG